MNLTEFLSALREATTIQQIHWHVNGAGIIRTNPDYHDNCQCPITAVYQHKFNKFLSVRSTAIAADDIGLSEDLASSIAWAADSYEALPIPVHSIRQELLRLIPTSIKEQQ